MTGSGWSLGYYFNVIQLVMLYITCLCEFTIHTFRLLSVWLRQPGDWLHCCIFFIFAGCVAGCFVTFIIFVVGCMDLIWLKHFAKERNT